MEKELKSSRILMVDDAPANLLLLELILDELGYTNTIGINDPTRALETWDAVNPDLVLLDLHMPVLSGLDVLATIRSRSDLGFLPVLMLTADDSSEAKVRALSAGANDFLTKPFNHVEVRLRIENLLRTRHLHQRLQEQNAYLEERVAERTKDVAIARDEILARLAVAAEFRDDQTGDHTQRVGATAALLAQALGLPSEEVSLIRRAAPLHDVGKIGVPDGILLKPGPLDDRELELMRRHTHIGARIVSGSSARTLQMAEQIAGTHHERWDGTGYGAGLSGRDIPIAGRIVAVADVFDALTHPRPYKDAWSQDAAIEEIREQRGRQFDPSVVDAFLDIQQTIDLRDEALSASELYLVRDDEQTSTGI